MFCRNCASGLHNCSWPLSIFTPILCFITILNARTTSSLKIRMSDLMDKIVNEKSSQGDADIEVDFDFEDKMSEEDIESTGADVEAVEATKMDTKSKGLPGKSRRKLRSVVWNFFDIIPPTANDKRRRSKCKKCGTSYICDSKNGTGNMQKHIRSCVRKNVSDVGQLLLAQENGSIGLLASKFDPEMFLDLLVTAIILHDLPFQFAEHEGIRTLLKYLHPDLHIVSRNTVKARVLKLHQTNKLKLRSLLDGIPGRVSLTSDMWTSIATDGYICLTGHFIDNNWELRKVVLNFSPMPPPHTGVAIAEKLFVLISEWRIENKIFSLTLDNASANDVAAEVLKSQLNMRNALLENGDFFHLRCCAHILNLIVKEGLKDVDVVLHKIRETIKYIKGSQVRKDKLIECINLMSIEKKKGLRQDVPTRWNSTYLMLDSAIFYKRALCHMELSDSNYKHCPSVDQWERAEKVMMFFSVLYDLTRDFSGTKYPTSNLFFPGAFVLFFTLVQASESSDNYVRSMADRMMVKFNKYWSEFVLILAIAVTLDPRYKFQFVEFCFKKCYPETNLTEITKFRGRLFALFDKYVDKTSTPLSSTNPSLSSKSSSSHDDAVSGLFKEFDSFQSESLDGNMKSQLELYLEAPKVDRNSKVDVLKFWKAEQYRYPQVAAMARDILAIPISTVASESAFSTGGRVLDQYRSCLKSEVVEALLCTKSWILNSKETARGESEEFLKLEELTEDIVRLHVNDKETTPSEDSRIDENPSTS